VGSRNCSVQSQISRGRHCGGVSRKVPVAFTADCVAVPLCCVALDMVDMRYGPSLRTPGSGSASRWKCRLPAGFLPGWWSLVKIVSALTLSPAESTSSVPVAEPSHGISSGLVSTTAVRGGW